MAEHEHHVASVATVSRKEPLQQPQTLSRKYILFPLQYPCCWEFYRRAEAAFWTSSELDLSADRADWMTLPKNVQHFLSTVLAFFASSDMIVVNNLQEDIDFLKIQIPEIRTFYAFQAAVEAIHTETYCSLIQTIISDECECTHLFNALDTMPAVKAKQEWGRRFTNNPERTFTQKLVAFAIFEGLLFAGSFASIYWLRAQYPGKMVGLTTSNELIARDESLHCEFAVHLYRKFIVNKLTDSEVHTMIQGAVDAESEFIDACLPKGLPQIDAASMKEYIHFQANRLCRSLGHSELYQGARMPFEWMHAIGLMGKSNFFEKRTTEYARAETVSVNMGAVEDCEF